jgi:hypothetical protein
VQVEDGFRTRIAFVGLCQDFVRIESQGGHGGREGIVHGMPLWSSLTNRVGYHRTTIREILIGDATRKLTLGKLTGGS